MQMAQQHNQRGMVLSLAVVTALIGSIAALAALMMAFSHSRHAQFHRERTRARYFAELGLVREQLRLWDSPADCGITLIGDQDGDTVADPDIVVTVSDCGPGNETKAHRLSAIVRY